MLNEFLNVHTSAGSAEEKKANLKLCLQRKSKCDLSLCLRVVTLMVDGWLGGHISCMSDLNEKELDKSITVGSVSSAVIRVQV